MKHLEVKSYRAEFKAATEGSKGIVTALVSVFNNIDLGGDRMLPGSFTKTIQDWQAKGDPLPVIWSHEWDDPQAHIGFVDPADLKETAQGLEVKMQFDLDRPFAEQVFHLQKTRRVTQFSFGYYVTDSDLVTEGDNIVRNIKSVDLFEVGPTLLGMNPATQLLEAASAIRGLKAGRTLNAGNEEALKTARDLIDSVLESAAPVDDSTASITGKSLDTLEAPADAQTDAPEAPASSESADTTRDSGSTINQEHVIALLSKPRHTED